MARDDRPAMRMREGISPSAPNQTGPGAALNSAESWCEEPRLSGAKRRATLGLSIYCGIRSRAPTARLFWPLREPRGDSGLSVPGVMEKVIPRLRDRAVIPDRPVSCRLTTTDLRSAPRPAGPRNHMLPTERKRGDGLQEPSSRQDEPVRSPTGRSSSGSCRARSCSCPASWGTEGSELGGGGWTFGSRPWIHGSRPALAPRNQREPFGDSMFRSCLIRSFCGVW